MDEQQQYGRLVQRYIENKATKEELATFFHLLDTGKLDAYFDAIDRQERKSNTVHLDNRHRKNLRRSLRLLPYAVAASLLLAVCTAAFLLFNSGQPSQRSAQNVARLDLPSAAPGNRKAVLTLSSGQTVTLDSGRQQFSDVAATIVTNNSDLVYQPGLPANTIAYNTITTPRGGEYSVTLPDGSTVWLNAGSSLRFPTAFTGSERRVELTGEAFFSVAKNKAQPFVVKAGGTEVEVLGTQFNVRAYTDEDQLKTTLEEGSVRLRTGGNQKMLKPGQGGTIISGKDQILVAEANLDLDLAWRRGFFRFDKTSLAAIMNQIGRWYDLDIRYAGNVPDKRYVGRISRQADLSEVLAILQLSGVSFSLSGKTLTVKEQ